MKFFFVGIKGAGMAALANILVDLGHEVNGCDYNKYFFTETLLNRKIKIYDLEKFEYIDDYIYLIGNVFRKHSASNEIKNKNGVYHYYADFIESFFKMPKVAISGTHGKTTTTSFLYQLSGKKENVLIGDGHGYGYKNSTYFVIEACEYQNTFLTYHPKITLINNMEHDHPDFFPTIEDYIISFQKLANQSEYLVINGDDEHSQKITHPQKITFGRGADNDIIFDYYIGKNDMIVKINAFKKEELFKLNLIGEHIAYNFCASYILAFLMGNSINSIKKRVSSLYMPSRRTNIYKHDDLYIVDDYAHHPTEIKMTLETLKKQFSLPLVLLYQPHTYSRLEAFYKDYVNALIIADEIYILPIFSSARSDDGDKMSLINSHPKINKFSEELLMELKNRKNQVIIFMGAGDVNNYITETFGDIISK